MSDISPRLDLPLIQPAQAQKHVTHNEALRLLDVLVQLTLEAVDATSPPALPDEGHIYALGAGASGAWAGHAGALAQWVDGAWQFHTPEPGWVASVGGAADLRVWTGAAWSPVGGAASFENLPGVGINTSSDATNRLAVSSPATLLSHEGAGHQLKINKAAASDTAALLFQSNWSGRAEMGLAGDDDFSIKLSANGAAWQEALRLTPGDRVYHSGNLLGTVSQSGGNPTGEVIERGSNANGEYVRFADGTQICTGTVTLNYHSVSVILATWTFPAAFAAVPTVTGSYTNSDVVTGTSTTAGHTLRLEPSGVLVAQSALLIRVYTGSPSSFSAGDSCPVSAQAIGRWY